MKVLISAFACAPGWGSEPEVGWQMLVQAARFHEVWVLTHPANRIQIESMLIKCPMPDVHFIYVNIPFWNVRTISQGVRLRIEYITWQVFAGQAAVRLHHDIQFDLGHHVTFASFRYPTFFSWMSIPFVWGPVGGGEVAPMRFWLSFGFLRGTQEAFRAACNRLARLNPFLHITVRRASKIFVTAPDTLNMLPQSAQGKTALMLAIGIETQSECPRSFTARQGGPFRLLSVGRLLYYKGVQFAIQAMAECVRLGFDVHLTVVGDGPYQAPLRELSTHLGIEDRVAFVGNLPREEVLNRYDGNDVFLFPSFHDSGGLAVIEAMAAGLPVICLDIGGPSQSVTDDTGILVPARFPAQVISDMVGAILLLHDNVELRHRLGRAGIARVESEYGWRTKGDLLNEIYVTIADGKRQ